LICTKSELSALVLRLSEFGSFHPSEKGLIQDTELLRLGSRAHAIYSEAASLLEKGRLKMSEEIRARPLKFEANDLSSLVDKMSTELHLIRSLLKDPDLAEIEKLRCYDRLMALKEASMMTFNDVSRVGLSVSTRNFAIVEGFVPSNAFESFKGEFGSYIIFWEPVERRGLKDPYVPSLLVNPRIISIFESITLVRGVPKYNEIDPTPITALVFPIFFGLMFSDVGHGIVLLILGILLDRRFVGKYGYWGRMLIWFGISATGMGFARGLFFGIEFPTPLRAFAWFPKHMTGGFDMESVSFWLQISLIFGTFHLASGYVLAFMNRIRSGDYTEAFAIQLPTLVLYSAAIPFVFALYSVGFELEKLLGSTEPTHVFEDLLGLEIPASLVALTSFPIVLISFALVVAGSSFCSYRSKRGRWRTIGALGRGLIEGTARSFEFFTNTISYLRLGILLIIGTVLGEMASGAAKLGWMGIPLAIASNAIVITIEAVLVYIQDLRLHIYEWLSHFYSGVGRPFRPLVSKGVRSEIGLA